ncbi:response regulator [Psychromonas sp. MME2]|uniref:response regulator n=1 Tax=unclassified Psychromonas TaxID=2614957 RepID=UPI00339C95DF
MKELKSITALVADDSPVMISSIRQMLVNMGLNEKNVNHAKDPKAAIWHCKKQKFDVIICDYNFFTRLNGRQVFEELKYYNLLNPEAVFIIITGESLSKVVRSIIELDPDEYLLKPFNSQFFTFKVKNALKRKAALYKLYEAKNNKNYKEGLLLADQLTIKFPQYYYIIQKLRGELYTLLSMFNEAKELYSSIVLEKDVEWANVGLADSLIELGELSRAEVIINKILDKVPNSVSGLSLNAKYDIYSGDVPNAIKQFSIISELAPGNPERELVIANLCLSQGDFRNAASRFMTYYELNIDTYRDSFEARYNYIRCILFIYDAMNKFNVKGSQNKELMNATLTLKVEALNEYKTLANLRHRNNAKADDSGESVKDGDCDSELILSHFAIMEGNISEAMTILKHLYANKAIKGFYSNIHYNYLLDSLSFNREFNENMMTLKTFMDSQNISPILLKSQLEVISSQINHHKKNVQYIKKAYEAFNECVKTGDIMKALDVLLKIRAKNKYIREVNGNLIKYLAVNWPSNYTGRDIRLLLKDCYHICKELYNNNELTQLGIHSNYRLAEDLASSRTSNNDTEIASTT